MGGCVEGIPITSVMRPDLLSLRPLHITEPLTAVNETSFIHIDNFSFNDFLCDNYEPIA